PRASDGLFGRGVDVQAFEAQKANFSMRWSLVEVNHDIGIFADQATSELEGVLVRDTAPAEADHRGGRGISLQHGSSALGWGGVEGTVVIGISLAGPPTTPGTLARDVALAREGTFGDGIVVVWGAEVPIRGAWIESGARAGVTNFGSHVSLSGTRLE